MRSAEDTCANGIREAGVSQTRTLQVKQTVEVFLTCSYSCLRHVFASSAFVRNRNNKEWI
ncbi:unnamed protein product, partial [Cylicocyclus nassatus]